MNLLESIFSSFPNMAARIRAACSALKKSGGTAYIVGGAVRDAIVNRTVHDIDIEVHGIPLDHLQALLAEYEPVVLMGKSFGVLRWLESGIDWSLPRTDSAGRRPSVQINPHLAVADALRRRDLTMNALALNVDTGELIDPFGGVADIKNTTLRTPDARFFPEDPLRFYRVLQFAARFGMKPDDELRTVCAAMDLRGVAQERIAAEYEKLMLQAKTPSIGFRVLEQMGRLSELLPELAVLATVPQDARWHPEGDVLEHTLQAVDSAAADPAEQLDRRVLIYSALCHDLGKASTTVVTPEKISSYRHELVGVPLSHRLLKRLTVGNALHEIVPLLVRWHMAPGVFVRQNVAMRAYKRLASRLAPHTNLRMLSALSYADRRGRNPLRGAPLCGLVPEIALFVRKAQHFGIFDGPEHPIVTGKDLIQYVEPGPYLGKLVRTAYEIQIEKGILDKDELIKRVLNSSPA
jgi:tRNA nucleotidyltransferase (CCA-adding enzyme)